MPESNVELAAKPEGGGFRAAQYAFAAHIRDPEHAPRPKDVEERRMAIYRRLFFGSIEGLLEGTFSGTRTMLGDSAWKALVRDFMVHHRSKSPLFAEMSREFLEYVGGARVQASADDPPYLLELIHYEWVKWALKVSDDDPDPHNTDPDGDLLEDRPVVSPLAWNLSYRYPVHRLDQLPPAEASPAERQAHSPPEQPSHLLVYRNPEDRVEFLELNAVTQRLVVLLRGDEAGDDDATAELNGPSEGLTGRAALEQIAAELRHPSPDKVVTAGTKMLSDLRSRGVLLGTRRYA
jgi:hypothetical protein